MVTRELFDMGYHTWDGKIFVEARARRTTAGAVMTVVKSIILGARGRDLKSLKSCGKSSSEKSNESTATLRPSLGSP